MSACLAGDNVRYDGVPVRDDFSLKLSTFVEVIKVCPEVELGLGVPRDKVILYHSEEGPRLFQPATDRELTEDMLSFARNFLKSLPPVDGFLLKSKSPSCGVSRTKTYRDKEGRLFRGFGKGIFALEVLKRFPHLPVEDELRLVNRRKKLEFLLGIYMFSFLREKEPKKLHSLIQEPLSLFLPGTERRLRKANVEEYGLFIKKILKKLPVGVLETLGEKFLPEKLRA